MKILLTITLALLFVFMLFYSIYCYGVEKNIDPDKQDDFLTVCAILLIFATIFGCLTLAVWLVWR